jgi:ACS family tartrate transporter-like MFS transporter
MDPIERATLNKVAWRLMPLLIGAFIISYLDRVNVGFAAITANKDIGLSATMYGFGAGLTFIGYCLFEVPSNLALERFGARKWLARIMVTWGIFGCAMAWAFDALTFCILRFLIGAAEAGLFPGVILYLTYWIPARHRARYIGVFALGMTLANVIGAPISGLLLDMHGFLGFRGWQWLYLLESVPAILLGITFFFVLPDRPADARWLTAEQKAWLQDELRRDQGDNEPTRHKSSLAMITDRRVLMLAAVFFLTAVPSYGLGLWLPQIIKSAGFTNVATGLLAAVPFAFGSLAMIVVGALSDRNRERVWHTVWPTLLSFAGLAIGALASSPMLQFIAICCAAMGIYGIKGPFLALVSQAFSVRTAAAGIAAVSMIGNLSGFAAPYMVGLMIDKFGSYRYGLLGLALQALLGAVLLLVFAGSLRKRSAQT